MIASCLNREISTHASDFSLRHTCLPRFPSNGFDWKWGRGEASGSFRGSPDDFHANLTCPGHADCPSSAAAEIDSIALHKGSSIIDPHYYGPAITRIGNSNARPEAKRSVGCSHRCRIEPLTRRRSSARMLMTIVCGNLRLCCTCKTCKCTCQQNHSHCVFL